MPSAKKMLMDIIEPTIERQYGGGLDDAYMTLSERRRRSSAFADPDATSAFANGGLPMIYRQNGGDFDFMSDITQDAIDAAMDAAIAEEAGFDEFDQADADAGAAGDVKGDQFIGGSPNYISYDSRGRAIQTGSPADEALNQLNIRNAAVLGGERYRDRFDELEKIDRDSELSNLQLIQRGIDRGLYNKAGVPLANFLEDKGLATFGKGMRGPFEISTPGGALYRYADDKRSEEIKDSEKRGVYGEVGFEDSSPESKEFEMRLRYAKPGETVKDIAQQMFDETKMVAPTQNFGYSPDSEAQATQVWDALNDARGAGMIQGLGLLAMGASSPQTLASTIGSQYDNGETRSILGQIGKTIGDKTGLTSLVGDSKIADRLKTAVDVAERGPGIFTIDPLSRRSVPSDPRDMTSVVNPKIDQRSIEFLENQRDKYLKAAQEAGTFKEMAEMNQAAEDAQRKLATFINQPPQERPTKRPGKIYSSNSLSYKQPLKIAPSKRVAQENITATVTDTVKKEGKGNIISDVMTGIGDFFSNLFKGDGTPVTEDPTDLGPNETGLRQIQRKPTQQEVTAVVTEVAKTPVEVQKTITSAGLLPQYLALIRAGYTAERAITAIGLPEGTQIG